MIVLIVIPIYRSDTELAQLLGTYMCDLVDIKNREKEEKKEEGT